MRGALAAGLAAALLASSALSGCASWTGPQTTALRTQPPSGLAPQVELGAVPFIAQTPLHCGPASLAMVLRYIGRDVSTDALAEAVFLPARGGTLQAEMLAGARRHDALPLRLPPSLESLLRELQAGHPVVVLQNLGLAIAPLWHYAVVIGFDVAREELVLRSGLVERETMSWRTFEHTWARAGHWAMVVLPPGRLATSADERATLDAALAFERVAPAASASRVYQSLLARWPDDLVAAIGLGNARAASGDRAGAIAAFEAAAARHDSAAAWNNLATLHWEQGDRAAAQAALARAQRRVEQAEPAFAEAVQATRRTIEAAPTR
jgi:tetratricopeptide (TPR) repeat protein